MKKFFSIYVVLFITAFITMVSCTKEEIMTENEFIEVGLNIKTDRLPLASEIPLTKGASADIYGLNIYEYKDDLAENPYCYGLFTSLDKLTIKFRKGYKYFIMIDYIPNGQNIIGFDGLEWGSPFYRALHVYEENPAPFNQLIYSAENCLMGLGCVTMHIAPNKLFDDQKRGDFERYLYQDWDFVPPKDGVEVDIELVRANAGVTFEFEKVDGYSYSKVDVKLDCFEQTVDLTKDNKLVLPQITMSRSYNLGYNIKETDELTLRIGTSKNETEIFNGVIEIKRNTMRTYTVKLKPESTTDNPFDISLDETAMSNENKGSLN